MKTCPNCKYNSLIFVVNGISGFWDVTKINKFEVMIILYNNINKLNDNIFHIKIIIHV